MAFNWKNVIAWSPKNTHISWQFIKLGFLKLNHFTFSWIRGSADGYPAELNGPQNIQIHIGVPAESNRPHIQTHIGAPAQSIEPPNVQTNYGAPAESNGPQNIQTQTDLELTQR